MQSFSTQKVQQKVSQVREMLMWQWYMLNATIFICRSSHSQMFFKIRTLKKIAKFTGKHLCQSLFFNTVAGLTLVQVLSCELYEIFKNNFITEHLPATASLYRDGKIALREKCPNMEFFLVHKLSDILSYRPNTFVLYFFRRMSPCKDMPNSSQIFFQIWLIWRHLK